jgi:Domain of Unknown Function (DUF1080)
LITDSGEEYPPLRARRCTIKEIFKMKIRTLLLSAAILLSMAAVAFGQAKNEKGFNTIFDGKTFTGWRKAEENPDTWTIKEGAFVAAGPRNHLYYVGDPKPFVNFELKIDVMTEPGSNGGVYFHTEYQPEGWPKKGFEVQVNQTHTDWKKTGSLYDVVNVKDQLVKDNEWYTYDIVVKDKHVTIKVNDKIAVDWEQPADWKAGETFTRILDKGTFALQAHDPKSVVRFKNIRVKRLN